jgi:hypothetical protein
MTRNAAQIFLAISLAWAATAAADGIRCTQEGLWSARCADSRGNVVGGDLAAKDGGLLTFGKNEGSRCGVDAAGNPTCSVSGKTLGVTAADLVGSTQAKDAKAKPQHCTSNGLGVTHCTDGSMIGQKCISDGMGGTRCNWELRPYGAN